MSRSPMNEEDLAILRVWSDEMTVQETLQALDEIAQREQEMILTTGRKNKERQDYMRNLSALIRAQSLIESTLSK